MKIRHLILLCIFGLALLSSSAPSMEKHPLVYCTQSLKIEFDPTSEMPPPGFYQYAFPRPILGTEGIISKIHISPDGKTIEGQIRGDLKFAFSKNSVIASDVANSIALYFLKRESHSIVSGSNFENPKDLWNRKVSGIEVLDDINFRLTIETERELLNFKGRLMDALNRSIPSRKGKIFITKPIENGWDFVSKYDMTVKNNSLIFNVLGQSVELRGQEGDCSNADFLDYRPKKYTNYVASPSVYSSPRLAVINTNKFSLVQRRFISLVLRKSVNDLKNDFSEINLEPTHFRSNEALQSPLIKWDVDMEKPLSKKLKFKKIRILIPKDFRLFPDINEFSKKVVNNFRKEGIEASTEWGALPLKFIDQDVGIFSFATANGRPKWVEGTLSTLKLDGPLKSSKKTYASLEKCYKNASATVPINDRDLLELDLASFEERSIVPLYREYSWAYTVLVKRDLDFLG